MRRTSWKVVRTQIPKWFARRWIFISKVWWCHGSCNASTKYVSVSSIPFDHILSLKLSQREITFPVTIEPEMCNTIPNICEFYRPIRQYLYSILFAPQTIVREQVYNSEHGSFLIEVCCDSLSSTCTIEQLWFGSNPDGDRQLRLKTFLQSLQYCDRPRFYTLSHDYLLLVCILRYMYITLSHHSSTSVGIHTYEWMAFISQAVLITELQPKPLMNLKAMHVSNQYEHIQIANYETRPVQLAHLFMRGLETMVFANEVCGSPIHPRYACPSHFFNGKLFHQKYLQAQYYQQTQDLMALLCDGNVRKTTREIVSSLWLTSHRSFSTEEVYSEDRRLPIDSRSTALRSVPSCSTWCSIIHLTGKRIIRRCNYILNRNTRLCHLHINNVSQNNPLSQRVLRHS